MNLIWVAANLRHSKANSHRPAKVVAGAGKIFPYLTSRVRSYLATVGGIQSHWRIIQVKYEYLHHQAAWKSDIF